MVHVGSNGSDAVGSLCSVNRRRSLRRLCVVILVLPVLLASCSESHDPQPKTLLVVGDSVAAQSAEALIHLAPPGTTVSVDAAFPGTAPCDWNHGFTDPTDGEFKSFVSVLDRVHPAFVAFVFTGNPGLSGPTAGCVDANRPYDVSQLLASYEAPLAEMADKATGAGATVYFEAPPPRNPSVPVGYDPQKDVNHGFQGMPAVATFYQDLVAAKNSSRWKYDDNAAAAVSTASLAWQLTLPCEAWDAKRCTDGRVQVRVGSDDAVHLDDPGCGAVRFALGLEARPLDTGGLASLDSTSVSTTVHDYGGCE
jgi:hypothetical protein